MNALYDQDTDAGALADKTVAVIGYGSQGRAHALNLHEAGHRVVVGLREGSQSFDQARQRPHRCATRRACGGDSRCRHGTRP